MPKYICARWKAQNSNDIIRLQAMAEVVKTDAFIRHWAPVRVNGVIKGEYVRNAAQGVPDSIVERKDVMQNKLFLIGIFQQDDYA